MDTQIERDARLIADLGGAAKVAELLGYDKTSGGLQRVHNWTTRGIPSAVKVEFAQIFLRELIGQEVAPPAAGQSAAAEVA